MTQRGKLHTLYETQLTAIRIADWFYQEQVARSSPSCLSNLIKGKMPLEDDVVGKMVERGNGICIEKMQTRIYIQPVLMTVHYLMVVECLSLSNNIYENYGLSKSVNTDLASLKIKNAFFRA